MIFMIGIILVRCRPGRRGGGVGTPSATTESRVESDDSTVCPAPAASSTARSYAAVVAGKSATHGSCSLVRSQRSEVNFRRSC